MGDRDGGLSGPAWADTPVPFEEALDGTLGFEVLYLSEGLARGRVLVIFHLKARNEFPPVRPQTVPCGML